MRAVLFALLLAASVLPATAATSVLPCVAQSIVPCQLTPPLVCVTLLGPCTDKGDTRIPAGQTVVLEGGSYEMRGDIAVEGALIVRNATLKAVPTNGDVRQIHVWGGNLDITGSTVTGEDTSDLNPHLQITNSNGFVNVTSTTARRILWQISAGGADAFGGRNNFTLDTMDDDYVIADASSLNEEEVDAFDNVWSGTGQARIHSAATVLRLGGNDFGTCLQDWYCVVGGGSHTIIDARDNDFVVPATTGATSYGSAMEIDSGDVTLMNNRLSDDDDPITHGFTLRTLDSGVIDGGSIANFGTGIYFFDAQSFAATTISNVAFSGNGQDVFH